MAFKNEFVPLLQQEASEFFRRAQDPLDVMAERRSRWTVDRERRMALALLNTGGMPESAEHDLWAFIDRKGVYWFSTRRLRRAEVSPEEIAITYELQRFILGRGRSVPDSESLQSIKEALSEHKDWGMDSKYERCRLTLIDGRTGKEI
jgi:hypothetical protein